MEWITPKTDWKDGDGFNLSPDYARIKGNIEYLNQFSEKLYAPFSLAPMADYQITDFPHADFLNVLADNTELIRTNTYSPLGFLPMSRYAGNGPGWTGNDLNILENNLLNLYKSLSGQWNALPQLAFEIGGSEF